jgi:hypothetical protein
MVRTILASSTISCRSLSFHNNVQLPSLFTVLKQVCAGVFPVQVLSIVLSYFKGQSDSSINAEDRQFRAVKPNCVRPSGRS